MLPCYNKGCTQKFDPDSNGDAACVFHPGVPVFHDASKKWSCCNKSSVDFTTFLQLPGCAKGPHNPVKPPEVPKPERPAEIYDQPVVVRQPLRRDTEPRPPDDEEKMPLNKQVDPRLLSELDKASSQPASAAAPAAASDGSVPSGTGCKNSGCRASYAGPQSDRQVCFYHPGGPVFHEGMKYWSCCQRKTSEFDSFMAQEGCEQGKHRWALPDAAAAASADGGPVVTSCRCDHHQGKAGYVTLDVFAKLCLPEECRVTANRVACSVELVFAGGRSKFARSFKLRDVIDPTQSCVNIRATKVEIQLKKANAANWPSLELL